MNYVGRLEKESCPCECHFRKKDLPIITIPAPKNPEIILVSRDPTTDFLPIYAYSEQYDAEQRRKMLFTAAIPHLLIVQITKFLRVGKEKGENEERISTLYEQRGKLFTLYESTYWTHLQKCPTVSCAKNGFKKKYARICADKWLEEELSHVVEAHDIKALIALGNDVQEWIDKWNGNRGSKIISLPHPSNQNNRYWCRNEKYQQKINEMEEEIEELVDLL